MRNFRILTASELVRVVSLEKVLTDLEKVLLERLTDALDEIDNLEEEVRNSPDGSNP